MKIIAPTPLPTPPLALSSPTPPSPLTKIKEEKNEKSWIWIVCHSRNVHNFTGIPSSTPHPHPTPPYPSKKIFFPGFGFFVKIHLLESLKLELYDSRIIHSWSFFFFFGNMVCMKCVDGF